MDNSCGDKQVSHLQYQNIQHQCANQSLNQTAVHNVMQ